MLELIKKRCGIAAAVKIYDEDIKLYIEDAKADMEASGVDESLIEKEIPGVVTAITFYVKANLGNDRTDTSKYMALYQQKVFRLSLEEPEKENVE